MVATEQVIYFRQFGEKKILYIWDDILAGANYQSYRIRDMQLS